MSKTFKTIWNVLSSIVIGAVLILAMLLSGVRLFGFQVYAVLSGSMEPLYKTGSLIYVRELEDTKAVPDGTVITFMANEDTIVTHRVVAAVPDEEDPSVVRYRTKGDANDMEDGMLVHYRNIIGTPVFTIPKLGYVANYIQQPPGSYLTISLGAVFVLLLFLPELLSAFFENEEKTEKPRRSKKAKRSPKSEYDFPCEQPPRRKRAEDYARPAGAYDAYPRENYNGYPEDCNDGYYDDYPEDYYADYPGNYYTDYPGDVYGDYPMSGSYPEEDYRPREVHSRRGDTAKSASRKRRGGAHCAK